MTIADLKSMIEDLPDDMEVIIPLNAGNFDELFYTPCMEESGEAEMGLQYFDGEDYDPTMPNEHERSFVLAPCGFFSLSDEDDFDINPELN